MRLKWAGAALAAALVPTGAYAHDAFGDLGPFYGGLLHPLVDPVQGLIIVAMAVLLASQPRASVRVAYAAAVIAGALAILVHAAMPAAPAGVPLVGFVVAGIGLLSLLGPRIPVAALAVLAGALAAFAGVAGDMPNGVRAAMLSAGGSIFGIALLVLLVWSGLDLLQSRLGRIVSAIAGSWVAAIGVMAAALPAVTS
jgi:urease accessory protein